MCDGFLGYPSDKTVEINKRIINFLGWEQLDKREKRDPKYYIPEPYNKWIYVIEQDNPLSFPYFEGVVNVARPSDCKFRNSFDWILQAWKDMRKMVAENYSQTFFRQVNHKSDSLRVGIWNADPIQAREHLNSIIIYYEQNIKPYEI